MLPALTLQLRECQILYQFGRLNRGKHTSIKLLHVGRLQTLLQHVAKKPYLTH